MKHWTALLPLALSFAGLALIFGHVATYAGVRETDEGTAAHLWQLFMAAQLPVMAAFAITWLPRAPIQALLVLALQVFAVIANLASLRYFEL
jgi:cytochrome bd-type quinol oxidase subunit 2